MQEKVQVHGAPGRCPYCHDELTDAKPVVACAACGARQHQGCHEEHGVCSACGAAEALYPREKPGRSTPLRPPAGSRIRVEEDGERTTLTWHVDPVPAWLWALLAMPLLLAAVVLLPLALWQWWRLRGTPPAERDDRGRVLRRIKLGEDALEIPSHHRGGTIRIPRDQVGAITVSALAQGGSWQLSVDAGLKRYVAARTEDGRGLAPPELEWLAERIRLWAAGE